MSTKTIIGAAALALAVGTTAAVGQVSSFVVLPPAPGHDFLQPLGISGDGTTVFGKSGASSGNGIEAYRWTAALGAQNIGASIAGSFSEATASTIDGTKLYGRDNGSGGFVWIAPGTVSTLSGGPVVDVSADGSVRITRTERIDTNQQALPPLPGDQEVVCASISADGDSVALTSKFFESGGGYGYGGGPDIVRDQACRWSVSGGTVGCGFLPGTDRSFATCISENGAVVLGTCRSGSSGPSRAFRWTQDAGIAELLPISGQPSYTNVEPVDSSVDGSVVVCNADGQAVVWTEATGFRTIKQILVANGWDVATWEFYAVSGISDNGNVITGNAYDDQGQFFSYVTPLGGSCAGPSNPWTATRRVVVAEGDLLPGGGTASAVSDITVNANGAALVRIGGDLWRAGSDGSLLLAVAAVADGFTAVTTATMNDAGVIAAARGRSQSVGGSPPQTEFVRSIVVGQPGSMVTIAAHGDAAPVVSGGGTLRTYGDFFGPFMSNGTSTTPALACFQTGIDGGNSGSIRAFVFDPLVGLPLVRSLPGVSLTAPITLNAVSDSGSVVRSAPEGVLAGGPPPAASALIAAPGAPAPGIAGGTYAGDFSSIGVNGAGTAVFHALVNTPSGLTRTLYTCAQNGTRQLLAAQGMSIEPGLVITFINRAVIGSTGSVYFIAILEDGRSAVVKAKPGGSLTLAAIDGDDAPGTGPCRELRNFNILGVDGRRVLLSATASGPSGSATVLATWGEEEGTTVIARTGETITLRPGLTGQVMGANISVLGGNGQDSLPRAMRGNHLVYTVSLMTDGGLVRAVVDDALPALPCGPGDLGSAGGELGADGQLDNNDFIAFITLFFEGDARADFGSAGGVAGSDGAFDNNDFIAFITAFFANCS